MSSLSKCSPLVSSLLATIMSYWEVYRGSSVDQSTLMFKVTCLITDIMTKVCLDFLPLNRKARKCIKTFCHYPSFRGCILCLRLLVQYFVVKSNSFTLNGLLFKSQFLQEKKYKRKARQNSRLLESIVILLCYLIYSGKLAASSYKSCWSCVRSPSAKGNLHLT